MNRALPGWLKRTQAFLKSSAAVRRKTMEASQNLPGVLPEAVRRDGGWAPGPSAGHENLVIVNLAEFAVAGPPRFTWCFADSALQVPGHDGQQISPWIPQTVR